MYEFWKNLISKRKTIVILLAIIMVGFVLRAYNFSDWLRVNMDQARDIKLVENSVQEGTWPALGPKAGGTDFALGPAFYYFQIISARIFGADFAGVAYPDLFFSLLSMPLFFLLAQIYFKKPVALSLTWLFAISYFSIKYSRFAWNPNATPFFVMLFVYAIYRINNTQGYKKNLWAVLAGIAMGVGAQLHTTLLVIMPIIAMLFAYYIYKNKTLTKTCVIAVIAGTLLVNIPQINTEIATDGSNTQAFFQGAADKDSRNTNLLDNVAINATCHARANFGILASYGREEECGYKDISRSFDKADGFSDMALLAAYLILIIIFSAGGYYLAFSELRKETDRDKKFFLKLIFSYMFLIFLFFTIWANELSMRFFLIIGFVPFLLLGFWLKFLSEKFKKEWILIAIIALVSCASLYKDYSVFKDLQFGGREINGDFEYITLGEVDFITDYIESNNNGNSTAYLDAQAGYLFKSFKSLQFVAKKKGIELFQFGKDTPLASGERLFYLRNSSDKCALSDNGSKKYAIEDCVTYRQFSVFALKVK